MKAHPELYELAQASGDLLLAQFELMAITATEIRAALEIEFRDGNVPEEEYSRLGAEIAKTARSIRAKFLWRARGVTRGL